MAKKEINEDIKLLKTKVQENKAIIGTERVIKELRTGKLSKVFLASNCSEKISSDVKQYAGFVNVPVIQLDLSNEELGVVCKKEFFISTIGIIE